MHALLCTLLTVVGAAAGVTTLYRPLTLVRLGHAMETLLQSVHVSVNVLRGCTSVQRIFQSTCHIGYLLQPFRWCIGFSFL